MVGLLIRSEVANITKAEQPCNSILVQASGLNTPTSHLTSA